VKLVEFAKSQGNYVINETFDDWSLVQELNAVPEDFSRALVEALADVSPRDRWEIEVSVGGSSKTFTSVCDVEGDDFSSHLSDRDEEDGFKYKFRIYKQSPDGVVSVYSFPEFESYLLNLSVLAVLSKVEHLLGSRLGIVFEVSSWGDESYGSQRIYFVSPNRTHEVEFRRLEIDSKLDMHRDCTHVVGVPGSLLPSDFLFSKRPTSVGLCTVFDKTAAVLSVCYLANNAELRSDDTIKFKISGYKSILFDGAVNKLSGSAAMLVKIADWAYEGGCGSDKIGLVRNVLSIHFSPGNFSVDQDVWEAIKSNYQIYLNDNVQSYLEVKNKLGEMLMESVSKSMGMVDDLLNGFKASVAVFVTFMLTVVVVNGVKDLSGDVIFSAAYLYVALGVSVFSLVWLLFSWSDLNKRFDNHFDGVHDLLVANYERIIMRSEIDSAINPARAKCKEILDERARVYAIWWIFLAFAFAAFFVVGYFFVHNHASDLVNKALGTAITSRPTTSAAPGASLPEVFRVDSRLDVHKVAPAAQRASLPQSSGSAPDGQAQAR
jgi:hypothetical protein